jgi:hypothetical protein
MGDHVYNHNTICESRHRISFRGVGVGCSKTQLLAHVSEVWLSMGVVYPMLPRSLGPSKPF